MHALTCSFTTFQAHVTSAGRRGSNSTPVSTPNTSSHGNNNDKDSDFSGQSSQQRAWKVMYANINRCLDQLYCHCEDEGSESKCHDAISFFERAAYDFTKLIDRMTEQRKFNQGKTTGVSWEVRKPTKNHNSWSPSSQSKQRSTSENDVEDTAATPTPNNNNNNNSNGKDNTHKSKLPSKSDDVVPFTESSPPASASKGFFSRLRAAANPYQPAAMVTDQHGRRRTGTIAECGVIVVHTKGSQITIAQQTDLNGEDDISLNNECVADAKASANTSTESQRESSKENKFVAQVQVSAPHAHIKPLAAQSKLNPTQQNASKKGDNKAASTHTGTRRQKAYSIDSNMGSDTGSQNGRNGSKKPRGNQINASTSSTTLNKMNDRMDMEGEDLVKETAEVTEQVWAAAEAWVEAEAQAEEEEWVKLVKYQQNAARSKKSDVRDRPITTTTDGKITSKSYFDLDGKDDDDGPPLSPLSKSTSRISTSSNTAASISPIGPVNASANAAKSNNSAVPKIGTKLVIETPEVFASASKAHISNASPSHSPRQALSPNPSIPSISLANRFNGSSSDSGKSNNEPVGQGGLITPAPIARANSNSSCNSRSSDRDSTRQGSPFASRERSLHEKLSSPDRRKALSPTEAKRRHDARQIAAESNRDQEIAARIEKASIVSTRVKLHKEKELARLAVAEGALEERLKNAEIRHLDKITEKKGKAGTRNTMVSEVRFINTIHEESVVEELQRRLASAEARTLAAYERRQDRLSGIAQSHQKRNSRKAQQMSALRLQLEEQKMLRWEKLQERLSSVQVRKEARLLEMTRPVGHAHRGETEEDSDLAPASTTVAGSTKVDPKANISASNTSKSTDVTNAAGCTRNRTNSGGNVGNALVNEVSGKKSQKDKDRRKRAKNSAAADALDAEGFLAELKDETTTTLSASNANENENASSSSHTATAADPPVITSAVPVIVNWIGAGSVSDPQRPRGLQEAFSSYEANIRKRMSVLARSAAMPLPAAEASKKAVDSGTFLTDTITHLSTSSQSGEMQPLQGKVGALLLQMLVNLDLVKRENLLYTPVLDVIPAAAVALETTPSKSGASDNDNGDSANTSPADTWKTVLSPEPSIIAAEIAKPRSNSLPDTLRCPILCTSQCRKQRTKFYENSVFIDRNAGTTIASAFNIKDWSLTEAGSSAIDSVIDGVNTTDPSAMKAFTSGGGLLLLLISFSSELGCLKNANALSTSHKRNSFAKALQLIQLIIQDMELGIFLSSREMQSMYALGVLVCDTAHVLLHHLGKFAKTTSTSIGVNNPLVSNHSYMEASGNTDKANRERVGSGSFGDNEKENSDNYFLSQQKQLGGNTPADARAWPSKQQNASKSICAPETIADRVTSWIEQDAKHLPHLLQILAALVAPSAPVNSTQLESLQRNFTWYIFASGLLTPISTNIRTLAASVGDNINTDNYSAQVLIRITHLVTGCCRYVRSCAGFHEMQAVDSVAKLSPRTFSHPRGKEMMSLVRSAELPIALLTLLDSILKNARVSNITAVSATTNDQMLRASVVRALVAVASVDINMIQNINVLQQQVLAQSAYSLLRFAIADNLRDSNHNNPIATNDSNTDDDDNHPIAQLLALLGLACLRNNGMQALVAQPRSSYSSSNLESSTDIDNTNGIVNTENATNSAVAGSNSADLSLIMTLCRTMPARYFTDEKYKMQLFPTLITMSMDCAEGLMQLKNELSSHVLSTHMSRLCRESEEWQKGTSSIPNQICALSSRFPLELWKTTAFLLSEN